MALTETLLFPVRIIQAVLAVIILGLLADGETEPYAITPTNALTFYSHHQLVYRIRSELSHIRIGLDPPRRRLPRHRAPHLRHRSAQVRHPRR